MLRVNRAQSTRRARALILSRAVARGLKGRGRTRWMSQRPPEPAADQRRTVLAKRNPVARAMASAIGMAADDRRTGRLAEQGEQLCAGLFGCQPRMTCFPIHSIPIAQNKVMPPVTRPAQTMLPLKTCMNPA